MRDLSAQVSSVFESRCESLLVVDGSVISGAAEGRPAN